LIAAQRFLAINVSAGLVAGAEAEICPSGCYSNKQTAGRE